MKRFWLLTAWILSLAASYSLQSNAQSTASEVGIELVRENRFDEALPHRPVYSWTHSVNLHSKSGETGLLVSGRRYSRVHLAADITLSGVHRTSIHSTRIARTSLCLSLNALIAGIFSLSPP